MEANGHLCRVDMRKGDVLLFQGASLVHGAAPWRPQNGASRRAVLLNFWSRYIDLEAGAGGRRPSGVGVASQQLPPHPTAAAKL